MNTGGQLGIGKSSNEVLDHKFHLVSALSNKEHKIVKLDCGADHSLALNSNGQVYGWGENEQGQLGLGDSESRNKPTLLSMVREAVRDISCGYYHSAVVTS